MVRLRLTATLAALLVGGCTTGSAAPQPSVSASPETTVDEALAAKVPEAIRADGVIVVGTDPTFVPAQFVDADGRTIVGFDVDLFKAVAAKLGLTAEFRTAALAEIAPGLATGAFEAGASSFLVSPQRKAQALMVSYFKAGTQWAIAAGNPAGVALDAPCGKRIVAQVGTAQWDDAKARADGCLAAKQAQVTITPVENRDQAVLAVTGGRADALVTESPAAGYLVRQSNGRLVLLGDVLKPALYGFVVGKNQPAFAEAIRGAVKALITEGTYGRILERWGVQAGAIPEPAVNP